MSTPITPSLSQMIRTHGARVQTPAPTTPSPSPAQTEVRQAPQVFKAADIAAATPPLTENARPLRPGSLLNIRV